VSPADARADKGDRRARIAPTWLVAWAHLAVLWSFAVAKPLLDVLDGSPEFFIARENTSGDIILLVALLLLAPPTLLLLTELALARVPRARMFLHLAYVALLTALLALQILNDVVGGSSVVVLPVAAALGAAGALAYARLAAIRSILSVLGPAPVVLGAVFLLFSPVSELVLPEDSDAARAGAPENAAPIVFVVLDELSGDTLLDRRMRIDRTRYPNFARLGRDATWYRNATTAADFTTEAVPALLSGLRPRKGDLPTQADHPNNLFSLLRDRYDVNAQEPITDLCSEQECPEGGGQGLGGRMRNLFSDLGVVSLHQLLPEDLEKRLPAVDQTFSGFAQDAGASATSAPTSALEDRPGQFDRFLAQIGRRAKRPTLDFLHIELPHVPWDYLPSGQRYPMSQQGVPGTTNDRWGDDRRLVVQGQQRYLLQLAYTDRLIGRLIARLRKVGLYERSLVVVTADHGVAFVPSQPRRAVTEQNLAEVASVPLFIKGPGQTQGNLVDTPASSVDVMPTIARAIGARLPWRTDGEAVGDRGRDDSAPVQVYAKYGAPLDIAFADFLARRRKTVARDTAIFGSGDRGAGIFAPGLDARLIGANVEDLPAAPAFPARVELEDPYVFASVRPRADALPVFVNGKISGTNPGATPIALVVGDRIAAVTTAYRDVSGLRLEAFVEPSLLRKGANRTSIYALRGSTGRWRAAPLESSVGERFRLVDGNEGLTIAGSHGSRFAVKPGAVDGFIEARDVEGTALVAGGWAFSREGGPAERVLLFAGDRFIKAVEPSVPRPDLVEIYGQRALLAGFNVSADLGEDASDVELRAFAVIGDRASELKRTGS